MEWTILETPDDVAKIASQRIEHASTIAIAERGAFHIVLTGGNTPVKTYQLLAKSNCDWDHWHVWFSDERCLPRDDPDRNSVMVEQTLTGQVSIPPTQVHVIPAEFGPESASRQYAQSLIGVPLFDLVLLGMGEDGHVASLFPGHKHPAGESVLAIYDSPKYPAERVSLGLQALASCRQLLFIITGREKAAAITQWRSGKLLPVSMVKGQGEIEVISDKRAFIA
ncbi:MAG: 6-phosphogluconolactonase [Arenicellales bacterium]